MRPEATAALGGPGISRFPCEVSRYVHGVSDRAGLWHASRYRCTRWGLPLLVSASASRSESLTRLDTRPACSPVNASTPPLRATPHDSGPMRVATPLSYDFSIHYTSPVLTGAQSAARLPASLACVSAWQEDFRKDLAKIDVPALVIHGDADRILPISAAGSRTAKLVRGARQLVVKDGPHCITWTHADEVNAELVNFLGQAAVKRAVSPPESVGP
jgi:pimeloyl-ACP methyl ester carboxylesterase